MSKQDYILYHYICLYMSTDGVHAMMYRVWKGIDVTLTHSTNKQPFEYGLHIRVQRYPSSCAIHPISPTAYENICMTLDHWVQCFCEAIILRVLQCGFGVLRCRTIAHNSSHSRDYPTVNHYCTNHASLVFGMYLYSLSVM